MDLLTYADLTLKEIEEKKPVKSFPQKYMQVIMHNVIDTELDDMLGSKERGEI